MKAYVEGDAGVWALAMVALVGFVVLLALAVQYARRIGRAFGTWLDAQSATTQNGVIGLVMVVMLVVLWVSIVLGTDKAWRLYERFQ